MSTRPLGDIGCRRFVLQQLDQFVLEDDLAGGDGDVAADLEGVRVGHLDLELALAALQVVEQMLQPLHQILAAGFQRLAQDLRVGHDEIARRHGIDELARIEIDLLRRLGVEPVHVADGGLHPAGAQQIGLLDEIEELVLLPGRIAEAAILGLGLDHRLAAIAGHALGRGLPELHIVAPEIDLGLDQLGRIAHHPGRHLHEGLADIEGVRHAGGDRVDLLAGGLALQEFGHQALGLLGNPGHGPRQLHRIW